MKSDIHEFKPLLIEIEESPQNPIGRVLLYIILAFLICSVLWLVFAKIDIVISSQGKAIPSGEIKLLKPFESGIIAKILIKEGQKVKKGDILIQIDPSVTDTSLKNKNEELKNLENELLIYRALTDENSLTLKDNLTKSQLELFKTQNEILKNLRTSYDDKTLAADFEINSVKSELNRLKLLLQKDKDKREKLAKVLDIIAKKDYEEVLNNIKNYKEQINSTHFKIKELEKKKSEQQNLALNSIKELKSKWLEIILRKEQVKTELESNINAISFSNKTQQIIAPVDGYVGKLFIHTEGSSINQNDTLLSIIPSDTEILIKAKVLNKDIGFVKQNQKVAIKIDTFLFQKYGLLEGDIINISKDAINDEKLGLIYEILIQPKSLEIKVENEIKNLEIGMSVIAEIKTGKRRIIELFIYPVIQYLDEGLSVR